MKQTLKTLALLLSAGALAVGAQAAGTSAAAPANDAAAALQAKVSLVAAVQAAEGHVGGKATQAEFETSKKHGAIYEVEVARADQVFDVRVDAATGKVLSTQPDHADGRSDREDDEKAES